uniref:Ig-like domain-containing protein n=1 Tax=Ciona savignyi TaxID=51511 RepID=H2YJ34_CIOSA
MTSSSRDDGYRGIHLSNVTKEDAGKYTCCVISDASVMTSAYVTIRVPPYFYSHVQDVTCGYGDVAKLHCDVTALPEPRVSWFKQDKSAPLRETPGKFSILKQCERVTLTIYDVTIEDIGCYTCKIWNELGEAQSTGRLFYSPSPG